MEDFLETTAWKNLSVKVRKRDGKCLRCHSTSRLCGDHIIPRYHRPALKLEEFNIQTLCWNCNQEKGKFYIVCFLENPSTELINELDLVKRLFLSRLKRYAERYLTSRNFNQLQKKIINDPTMFDVVEGVFNKILELPERVKNPLIKTILFSARFLALPVIMPAIMVMGITNELRAKPSSSEVHRFAEEMVKKRFSNW